MKLPTANFFPSKSSYLVFKIPINSPLLSKMSRFWLSISGIIMAMIGVLSGSEFDGIDLLDAETKYEVILAGVVRASGKKHFLFSSEFSEFAQRFSEMYLYFV